MSSDLRRIIKSDKKGLYVKLHILPNSKKSSIVGLYGEPPRLKIKLAAVPEKGKANKILLKYFSRVLDIDMQSLFITSGEYFGQKEIFIKSMDKDIFLQRLDKYLKK